ncbi:MAG TPA: MFS transporter [Legionella sp.]|nr:MFS transporter [Legionella sp.]
MSKFSIDQKWWVLIGVGIASFMGCLDFTVVNTALPAIQATFKCSVSQLQWVINVFIIALSTFMVISGRLADLYGRKKILLTGISLFALSSLGAGLSIDFEQLLIFRFLQGLSCAILYTTSGAIVSNAFPEDQRGKAIGLLFGINGLGLAAGPVIGAFIVGLFHWKWIFLINVPLAIIGILITALNVKESKEKNQSLSLDWFGLIGLLIALPCLILGLNIGPHEGWTSPLTLSLLALSFLLFIAFYFIEKNVSNPIIQFSFFVNRMFISSIVATFTLAIFYCLAFFLMPMYLHTVLNKNNLVIGLMLLPTTAMVAIMSPIAGKLVDRFGPRVIILFGFLLFLVSSLIQSQFGISSSLTQILIAFLIMGIGWAFILGPSTVASLSSVPENIGAVAMGSAWTMHNIGGAIGLSVGVSIFYHFSINYTLASSISIINKTIGYSRDMFIRGYSSSMWFLFVCSLLAFIVCFFGMRKE